MANFRSLTRFALTITALSFLCSSGDVRCSTAQERVKAAKTQEEAEAILREWDAALTTASELFDNEQYSDSISELERALRIVSQYEINEEGSTSHQAYSFLERLVKFGRTELIFDFLSDDSIESLRPLLFHAIIASLDLTPEESQEIYDSPENQREELLRTIWRSRSRQKDTQS